MLANCLISVEMANGIRAVALSLGMKVPRGRRGFRCPKCNKAVRPAISAEGKLAGHFEHYPGARCSM